MTAKGFNKKALSLIGRGLFYVHILTVHVGTLRINYDCKEMAEICSSGYTKNGANNDPAL